MSRLVTQAGAALILASLVTAIGCGDDDDGPVITSGGSTSSGGSSSLGGSSAGGTAKGGSTSGGSTSTSGGSNSGGSEPVTGGSSASAGGPSDAGAQNGGGAAGSGGSGPGPGPDPSGGAGGASSGIDCGNSPETGDSCSGGTGICQGAPDCACVGVRRGLVVCGDDTGQGGGGNTSEIDCGNTPRRGDDCSGGPGQCPDAPGCSCSRAGRVTGMSCGDAQGEAGGPNRR